jgi:hypothetical protein
LDGSTHRSEPLPHDEDVVGPAEYCWTDYARLAGTWRAADFSLENWAMEMATDAHTTVVVMGKDLEAGGAACGSKLRSMFDDFERFFPIVGRVALRLPWLEKNV